VKRIYRLSPSTSSPSTTLAQSKLLMVDLIPRKYEVTHGNKRVTNYKSAMRARCVISPMNANPEGFARHEAMSTTAAVNYAKAGNVTTTDVMTGVTTRRVPKSSDRVPKTTATGGIPKSVAQGRVLKTTRREAYYSPVIFTARVPTTPTQSVAKIRAIKLNRSRTTTNAPSIVIIKTCAPTTTAT
jgi:hypothetical protein